MKELISILLPTYNEPIAYIKESIESIQNQTHKNIEVLIIVDNPKRDDIVKLVENKQNNDSRLRLIINEKNLGLVASLNKAIDQAKGDFIARMDADDISNRQRLEKQLAHLKSKNFDLIGCDIVDIGMNGKPISGIAIKRPRTNADIKKYLKFNSAISHPTWLGKASLFRENKYREFPACEDYEYLTRISLKNKKLGNLGEVLLSYRINQNGISCSKKGVQKTGLAYIGKRFRKGKETSPSSFQEYISSEKGKKQILLNERFYKKLSLANKCRNEGRRLQYVLMMLRLLISNPNARKNMYGNFRSKLIKRKL